MPPGSWPGLPERQRRGRGWGKQGLPPGAAPSSRPWLRGPSRIFRSALPSGPLPSRWSPFSYVPAPVRVTGTGPPAGRGPPRPQRHRRGVQADRAVEAGQLLGAAHPHRRFEQVCDQFLQALAWLPPRPRSISSRLAASSVSGSTLSFASTEGSMTESTRWNR